MNSSREISVINAAVLRAEADIMRETGKRIRLIVAPQLDATGVKEELTDPYALLTVVANSVGLLFSDYKKDTRQVKYVVLRKLGAFFVRTYMPHLTLKQIGIAMDKDHTTIIHYLECTRNHIDQNDREFMVYYNNTLNIVTQWLAEN